MAAPAALVPAAAAEEAAAGADGGLAVVPAAGQQQQQQQQQQDDLPTCSLCKEKIPSIEDIVAVNDTTVRCSDCNALFSRVKRLKKGQSKFKGWGSVESEDKVTFYRNCHNMYGPDLEKELSQACSKVKTSSSNMLRRETGKFIHPADAAEMPRFKADPEALQALLQDEESTMVCQKTKQKLVCVPEYMFQHDQKDEEKNELKQDMVAKQTMKPKAKAKGKGKAKAKAKAAASIPEGHKKLTNSQKKKADQLLSLIESKYEPLAKCRIMGHEAEKSHKGLVGEMVLEKAKTIEANLLKLDDKLGDIIWDDHCNPEEWADVVAKGQAETKQASELVDVINGLLSMVGEDNLKTLKELAEKQFQEEHQEKEEEEETEAADEAALAAAGLSAPANLSEHPEDEASLPPTQVLPEGEADNEGKGGGKGKKGAIVPKAKGKVATMKRPAAAAPMQMVD